MAISPKSSLKELAKVIRDEVYYDFYTYKKTVFLCGAGKATENSVRQAVDAYLREGSFFYKFDVFYPEDLFDELLFGPNHTDLLTLENVLAESVDAIVIAVESYGAVAELGVFSSNQKLRQKLVCIVNAQYRRDKSFINYGPLRLMRDLKEGVIVFADFPLADEALETIKKAISKVALSTTKKTTVDNVLQTHLFVLACIYLLEPVERSAIEELVKHASGQDYSKSSVLAAGALSILSKGREVILRPEGYRLSDLGRDRFVGLGRRGYTHHTYDLGTLDDIRVAVLNWQCRGKALRI